MEGIHIWNLEEIWLKITAQENQDKIPTLFCYLNSIKPYKARFIANSSPCMTTELSKLSTLVLQLLKKHVIKDCEKVYESIKNSGEILIN